jgi:hypothetical protein
MMTTAVLTTVPMTMAMPTSFALIPATALEPFAMLSPSDVRRAVGTLLRRRD